MLENSKSMAAMRISSMYFAVRAVLLAFGSGAFPTLLPIALWRRLINARLIGAPK